ncbi:hypothetical protein NFJ02_20g43900 [Pycnococcus provasolii]
MRVPSRALRVLAVHCTSPAAASNDDPSTVHTPTSLGGAFAELAAAHAAGSISLSFIQHASADDVATAMTTVKPNVVYIGTKCMPLTSGLPQMNLKSASDPSAAIAAVQQKVSTPQLGRVAPEAFASHFSKNTDVVYLDVAASDMQGALLRLQGVPNVVCWQQQLGAPPTRAAAHFAKAFFAALTEAETAPSMAAQEAYVFAHAATLAHGTAPPYPVLLAGTHDAPARLGELLRGASSVAVPPHFTPAEVKAAESMKVANLVGGREVHTLICGTTQVKLPSANKEGSAENLTFAAPKMHRLAQALRSLLVLECRSVRVLSCEDLPVREITAVEGVTEPPPKGHVALLCEVALGPSVAPLDTAAAATSPSPASAAPGTEEEAAAAAAGAATAAAAASTSSAAPLAPLVAAATASRRFSVVLTGPKTAMKHGAGLEVAQHAIRLALCDDAVGLEVASAPPGHFGPSPPPSGSTLMTDAKASVPAMMQLARRSRAVAGGCPLLECVLTTSSMQLEILRRLAFSARYRGLVAAGVASVGHSVVEGFDRASVKHYHAVGRVTPLPEPSAGKPADKSQLPADAQPYLDAVAVLPDGTQMVGKKRARDEDEAALKGET